MMIVGVLRIPFELAADRHIVVVVRGRNGFRGACTGAQYHHQVRRLHLAASEDVDLRPNRHRLSVEEVVNHSAAPMTWVVASTRPSRGFDRVVALDPVDVFLLVQSQTVVLNHLRNLLILVVVIAVVVVVAAVAPVVVEVTLLSLYQR